jgi:hypothetical protein
MTGLREVVHFSFPFLVHFCIPGDTRSACKHMLAAHAPVVHGDRAVAERRRRDQRYVI